MCIGDAAKNTAAHRPASVDESRLPKEQTQDEADSNYTECQNLQQMAHGPLSQEPFSDDQSVNTPQRNRSKPIHEAQRRLSALTTEAQQPRRQLTLSRHEVCFGTLPLQYHPRSTRPMRIAQAAPFQAAR